MGHSGTSSTSTLSSSCAASKKHSPHRYGTSCECVFDWRCSRMLTNTPRQTTLSAQPTRHTAGSTADCTTHATMSYSLASAEHSAIGGYTSHGCEHRASSASKNETVDVVWFMWADESGCFACAFRPASSGSIKIWPTAEEARQACKSAP